MKNTIRRREQEEIAIEDETGQLVGRIRITPDRVMWGPFDSKKWRTLPLEEFGKLMDKHGDLKEF